MTNFLGFLILSFLVGCASMGDIAKAPLAVATHEGEQAAAAYADAHGFPARAAVRRAIDAQLTACETALTGAEIGMPAGKIDPILAAEIAEETVGTGIPAAVRLNCLPVPVPMFPLIPKLP